MRKRATFAVLTAGAVMLGAQAVVLAPAWASEAHSPGIVIAEMTGMEGTTNTATKWDVTATDLGIMWDDGAGGVLTAFGDTFGIWGGPGGGGDDWRSNVLLHSTDTDLSDGMEFDSAVLDAPGHAGEIIPSLKVPGTEHTTIPTAGIEVGGVQYLAYMSVRQWGPPGMWDTNFSRIAYSSDGGDTWNSTDGPTWENPGADTSTGDHPFQMVAFAKRDGYVYMFGTPNGRFGAAHVARVAEASILDKSAYEYWTGAAWETGAVAELAAAEIVPPNVAELSVLYNEHADKWIMTYLDENLDIVLRSADSPEGPWSASQAISTFADHPGLYGGFLHPSSTGEDLYLAMTQWDPYNVYLVRASIDEDANLTRPNLVQDPSFERTATADLGSAWGCLAPCGADSSHAWGMAGNHNAWLRYNSGWRDLYQTIAVEPNTEYELRMWLRTGGATDPGFYGVREADDTATPIAEGIFFNIPAWTEYRVTFDSGSRTEVEVFAGTWTNAGDRWLNIDDVSVVEVAQAPPPDPTEWQLELTSSPSGTVTEGDVVTYTAKVTGSSVAAIPGASVIVDLAGVVDDGELVESSVVATAGTAQALASSVGWSVDLDVSGSATLTFDVIAGRTGDAVLDANASGTATGAVLVDCDGCRDTSQPVEAEDAGPGPGTGPGTPPGGGGSGSVSGGGTLSNTGGGDPRGSLWVAAALLGGGLVAMGIHSARRIRARG